MSNRKFNQNSDSLVDHTKLKKILDESVRLQQYVLKMKTANQKNIDDFRRKHLKLVEENEKLKIKLALLDKKKKVSVNKRKNLKTQINRLSRFKGSYREESQRAERLEEECLKLNRAIKSIRDQYETKINNMKRKGRRKSDLISKLRRERNGLLESKYSPQTKKKRKKRFVKKKKKKSGFFYDNRNSGSLGNLEEKESTGSVGGEYAMNTILEEFDHAKERYLFDFLDSTFHLPVVESCKYIYELLMLIESELKSFKRKGDEEFLENILRIFCPLHSISQQQQQETEDTDDHPPLNRDYKSSIRSEEEYVQFMKWFRKKWVLQLLQKNVDLQNHISTIMFQKSEGRVSKHLFLRMIKNLIVVIFKMGVKGLTFQNGAEQLGKRFNPDKMRLLKTDTNERGDLVTAIFVPGIIYRGTIVKKPRVCCTRDTSNLVDRVKPLSTDYDSPTRRSRSGMLNEILSKEEENMEMKDGRDDINNSKNDDGNTVKVSGLELPKLDLSGIQSNDCDLDIDDGLSDRDEEYLD